MGSKRFILRGLIQGLFGEHTHSRLITVSRYFISKLNYRSELIPQELILCDPRVEYIYKIDNDHASPTRKVVVMTDH